MELFRIYQHFTTVRAHALLGELEQAQNLARRLRLLSNNFRRPLDAAEAGALQSAIHWAAGQMKEAQEMMEKVLSEMQPHALIRVIADEGETVVPVLKRITAQTAQPEYRGELERVYVNNVYLAAYAVSRQRRGTILQAAEGPVKLTRRQKMILSYLTQGYNRKDITSITGLSLSTVKTHINQTYRKLGVSNAADAVARAQELGIADYSAAPTARNSDN